MAKSFNTAAVCLPERHYMVNIDDRLREIKALVDSESYFTINRARQYGKTTMLRALAYYLQEDYHVVSLDFQTFGNAEFENENRFSVSFAESFLRVLKRSRVQMNDTLKGLTETLKRKAEEHSQYFTMKKLFEILSDICAASDKPVILMIDEADSAANNQVFLDFLAQLRAYYINRDIQATFQSVILAGVYDVKNLKRKLRPDENHKMNSPWNIAVDFKVDMSFSKRDIAGMLCEYEADYHTGMDIDEMAGMLFDYTSGYPFLVSRLCQLLDENISVSEGFKSKASAWTRNGFNAAIKIILSEKNTLFESLMGKLEEYPELDSMLRTLLFTGKTIAYVADNPDMDMATMFGFIKNQNGTVAIANRIFETRLYNRYLSETEMQKLDIYKASLLDKNQFVAGGHLNMRRVLEKFVEHFHELYGNMSDRFKEEEGRAYFLLYLRPIINGAGNYYVESRTRDLRRTDIIVDYGGEQHVIELKIWRGQEYNNRGEKQLAGYMEDYHVKKGYMISFNFNKTKETGVRELVIGDKLLIEAVV